jgi:hypothetical protein
MAFCAAMLKSQIFYPRGVRWLACQFILSIERKKIARAALHVTSSVKESPPPGPDSPRLRRIGRLILLQPLLLLRRRIGLPHIARALPGLSHAAWTLNTIGVDDLRALSAPVMRPH